MLHVVCALWDANQNSREFSRCYDETWVERLATGFRRHLTRPYRFVCFVDRRRYFGLHVQRQEILTGTQASFGYGDLIQTFRLNEPMILVGLDTIVTGNVDAMADYCLSANEIALPRNPKKLDVACNGVALVPAGKRAWFDEWRGENDMEWMISRPHVLIDDVFPGQVLSAKVQVKRDGLGDARLVYFHGLPKASDMLDVDWVRRHWLGEGYPV